MSATKIIKFSSNNPPQDKIVEIAGIIKKGGLVIIPTETVYGIAANLRNRRTIERLYRVKGRPEDKPFSLHIDDKDKIEDYACEIPVGAYKLIYKFWPGPLTLVLKSKSKGRTIGLRMPDNDIALRLIRAASVPIVCPSANFSDQPAPRNFEQAIKDLNGKVELAIDGGSCKIGKESSVVDLTDGQIKVLREGALNAKDIEGVASKKIILFVCTGNSCRSVMAKGLLEKKLKDNQRNDVDVLSAGIAIVSGYRATQNTVELLRGKGVDVSNHFTRRINADMIKKSDIILVMEKLHESRIVELVPQAKNRVFLLKEFAKIEDSSLDIDDPIGKPFGVYEHTFEIIEQAIDRIIKII